MFFKHLWASVKPYLSINLLNELTRGKIEVILCSYCIH